MPNILQKSLKQSQDPHLEARSTPPENLPTPARGFGWLLIFIFIYFFASLLFGLALGLYHSITTPDMENSQVKELIQEFFLSLDGISSMYIIQFSLLLPCIILASNFPLQHWRKTLALHTVKLRTLGKWAIIWFLFQCIFAVLSSIIEIPVDDFMVQMSGQKHLLFALVTVLLAPIMEEFLFRGYLFKAWRHSWLGYYGTVLVTSLLFTLMHFGQYNIMILAQLFIFALLLGFAREKTGSIVTPIFIHSLNNLTAIILISYLGL